MRYCLIIFFTISFLTKSFCQKTVVEKPILPYGKQSITAYDNIGFLSSKEISLDFKKLRLLSWVGKGWQVEITGTLSYMTDKNIVYVKEDQFVKTPEYREVLEYYDPEYKKKHEQYYNDLVKKYGKNIGSGIYFGVPKIGMTTKQFLMCREWPDDINTTETSKTLSEQWIYDYGEWGRKYYYFTNGKLTAMQD